MDIYGTAALMAKKALNNESNMKNPNKGTDGTNLQYAQNQSNRGQQLNSNKKLVALVKDTEDDEGELYGR